MMKVLVSTGANEFFPVEKTTLNVMIPLLIGHEPALHLTFQPLCLPSVPD